MHEEGEERGEVEGDGVVAEVGEGALRASVVCRRAEGGYTSALVSSPMLHRVSWQSCGYCGRQCRDATH